MKPWQAIMAVVPAGLLVGLAAGHASRPVMKMHDERPWPESVNERFAQVDSWNVGYEAGPEDLSPSAHSYRPDLDYSAFAWPDQRAGDAEMLAAVEFDYGDDLEPIEVSEPPLPQVHRARAELAAIRAEQDAAAVAVVADADPTPAEPATTGAALPPVPPPLAQASGAPAPAEVPAFETESF